jgi:Predicted transcriptional regulators
MRIDKIIELRKKRNWSRYKLSLYSHVPLSTLSDLERGKNKNPRIKTVEAIAKALGVNIDEIV